MQCRIELSIIKCDLVYDQPLFALAARHADVLQACYNKIGDNYGLQLADLQSLGGTSYAENFARIACPALNGSVEIRVDRLIGQFNGLASQQTDQARLIVSRCEQALRDIFPNFAVSSTLINVMSWLTCESSTQSVQEALDARHEINFDPRSVGAEAVSFAVRGQLRNEEDAWRIGFALEPSALPEYALYAACFANYFGRGKHDDFQERSAHISLMLSSILSQFGFEEGHS